MGTASEGIIQRHLLPGETIVNHYNALETSAKGFYPILTDTRLLFVGRRSAEDLHLNSISSMSLERKRRFGRGLLALGILIVIFALVVMAASAAAGGFLLLLGIIAIVVWAIAMRDLVLVFGGGRQFMIYGPANSLDDFIMDVRLQQQEFASYERKPTGT